MRSTPSPDTEAAPHSPRPLARAIVSLVFVALLALPLVIQRFGTAEGRTPELSVDSAVARYGFALREVAAEAGIRFTHQAPVLDPKLTPIMPVVAAFGAAVSVADFDRDGRQDLYVTTSRTGEPNALYRNTGDGFVDVAGDLGVADVNGQGTGVSMGSVWGDYDNDGYEDLFVYKWGRPELFHNDGGAGFTRVPDGAGLPAWVNANTATWFDYDGDGFLDLFLGGFYPDTLDLWDLDHTRIMPESFEFARNGGRNYLFRNRGDGTFEEVGAAMGLTTRRWTLASSTADVDRDGDPDLFVANDFGINELYLNDGDAFREVGRSANLARVPKSGMNASFADVFNRGRWNLFVTNISESGVLIHGNDLWVPGDEGDDVPGYRNAAGVLGVELAGFAFGAQFGDLNNDGWLDLFVANGYVSGDTQESYWYDYSKVVGGHEDIISDARNWPALQGRSLSGHQRDRVWLNDGAGRYLDVTGAVADPPVHDGRAVAFADLWNRGTLDVIVANQGGPLLVFRNTATPDHAWIAFELEGTRSNRSAIGAEVHLHWNDMEQVRQIEGGNAFAAQNQRRAHFGLGPAARVDSAVIRWPSGAVRTVRDPAVNQVHVLREQP